MERIVRLALYGDIEHPSPELDLVWDIFQSEALTRLRDISLSSTPSRFAAHGMAASRFEHSVGVAFLARKLCDRRAPLREHRDLLMSAALCHDIGSPPFSHISELFFYDLTGRTHEQETQRLLAPGTELHDLLSSNGVAPEEVVELVTGKHPQLGGLIAGSIDLDNIDNSLHLLRSMGYDAEAYRPLELIKAFRWRSGKVSLDTAYLSQIIGWAEARRQLYDLLHAEAHLSSATMLYRALEFAYSDGHLDAGFFSLGESDAMHVLGNRCGKKAGLLLNRALRWRQYHLLEERLMKDEDPRLVSLYDDWRLRKDFTDGLAAELGIPEVDFALYTGRDRGEKSIDVPFVGDHAEEVAALFARRSGPQRLALFSEKSHLRLKGTRRLERALEAALDRLPEAASPAHVFF